jgi:hypothetical protein
LVKCDKCGKSLTAKSLKYSHKCGQDTNRIIKQPIQQINDSKNEPASDFQPIQEIKRKPNFPPYETNPRIQMMQEKREKLRNYLKMQFKYLHIFIYKMSQREKPTFENLIKRIQQNKHLKDKYPLSYYKIIEQQFKHRQLQDKSLDMRRKILKNQFRLEMKKMS